MFSLKTGTVMEGSKLPYRVWAIAICLFMANIKGMSSMRLHRELGIGPMAAWFMIHRLRTAFEAETGLFARPVEADGTYTGGKRRNMSNAKPKGLRGTGRDAVGKAAVVGVKDRTTNEVRVRHVESTDAIDVAGFVGETTKLGATVYPDQASAYNILGRGTTSRPSSTRYRSTCEAKLTRTASSHSGPCSSMATTARAKR